MRSRHQGNEIRKYLITGKPQGTFFSFKKVFLG